MLCKPYIFLIFSMYLPLLLALPISTPKESQKDSSSKYDIAASSKKIGNLASVSESKLPFSHTDILSKTTISPQSSTLLPSFPSEDPSTLSSKFPQKAESDTLTPDSYVFPSKKVTTDPPAVTVPVENVLNAGDIVSDAPISSVKETKTNTETKITTQTRTEAILSPLSSDTPNGISKVSEDAENVDIGNEENLDDMSFPGPNARMDEDGFELDDFEPDNSPPNPAPSLSGLPLLNSHASPTKASTLPAPLLSISSLRSTPFASLPESSIDSTLRTIPPSASSLPPSSRSIITKPTNPARTTEASPPTRVSSTNSEHTPISTPSNRRMDDFFDSSDDVTDVQSSTRAIEPTVKSTFQPQDDVGSKTTSHDITALDRTPRTRRRPPLPNTQTEDNINTSPTPRTKTNTHSKSNPKSEPTLKPPRIPKTDPDVVSDPDTELDTGTSATSSSSSTSKIGSTSLSSSPTGTSNTFKPTSTNGSKPQDSLDTSKIKPQSATENRDVEEGSFLNHLNFTEKQKAPTNRLDDQAINPNASGEASCGNGFCEVGETCDSCPFDCASIVSSFVVRCNLGIQRCHPSFTKKTVVLKVIQNPSLPHVSNITEILPSEFQTRVVPETVKRQFVPFLQPFQDLKLLKQHPGVRSLSYIGYHNNVTSAIQYFTSEGFEIVPVEECIYGRPGPFLKWDDAFHFDLYG